MTNLDEVEKHIKKQRHYLANKGPSSQGYGFSSDHVWMWELDCEEGWAPKNWCFQIVVLEETKNSLDSKGAKPVNTKGNQRRIVTGSTDAEAEAQILWTPEAKSWLIGKVPDAGKDWGQEEKGARQQRMRWLDGITDSNEHEVEQTLGDSIGQGSLECCSSQDGKKLDLT